MKHHKFAEARTLIDAGIAVLLTGEKGSGKTTLARMISEDLELEFYSVSMTRQTTLSYLLGFMNVNGIYIDSLLRKAAEHGGMFVLDELDAGDPNVLLALNTIENGYISFPDKIVYLHENFRLVATANPQDEHAHYTGRAKLDGATLDRFDEILVDRDENLEKSLVDRVTIKNIALVRKILKDHNSSTVVSMRDSIRYQARKNLNLLENFVERILGNNPMYIEKYKDEVAKIPDFLDQDECVTFMDVVKFAATEAGMKVRTPVLWQDDFPVYSNSDEE